MRLKLSLHRRGAVLLLALIVLLAACVPMPIDSNWAQISLLDNQIVLPFHDRLMLIDPLDGTLVELRDSQGNIRLDDQGNPRTWSVQTGGRCIPDCFYATPLRLDEDTLLVPSYNKKLVEVDLIAARVLDPAGRALDGHIVGSPLMTDDFIFVPFSERNFVALNRDDLQVAWTFQTQRGNWTQPLLIADADAGEGDLLVVPSMDHNLYALDAETGEQRWAVNLDGAVGSTPLLHEGLLYVGSFGGKMFQINLDGQILATFEGIGEWVWGTPAIADNILYTADTGGMVYALAIESGGFRELWKRQVAGRAIRAAPIVNGDQLIVASRDHRVYWLRLETGEEIFQREVRGEILADMLVIEPSESLAIPEPLILVPTMAREEGVVAFALDDGERRWAFGF
jgi:outer membrane protein assembly factor BamB